MHLFSSLLGCTRISIMRCSRRLGRYCVSGLFLPLSLYPSYIFLFRSSHHLIRQVPGCPTGSFLIRCYVCHSNNTRIPHSDSQIRPIQTFCMAPHDVYQCFPSHSTFPRSLQIRLRGSALRGTLQHAYCAVCVSRLHLEQIYNDFRHSTYSAHVPVLASWLLTNNPNHRD